MKVGDAVLTEVVLECNHVRHFHAAPPHLRQRIWCTGCSDMKLVIGRTGSYRAVCRDCGRLNLVRDKPRVLAKQIRAHLNGHPKHRVILARIGTDESCTVTLADADTTESEGHARPILTNIDTPNTLF